MKTALLASLALASFATACTDDVGDLGNPDPNPDPDPAGEVVNIDAQARMLPSSTTGAIAIPFDLCTEPTAAHGVYLDLLHRSLDGSAAMPTLVGTVATFDARAQTKTVRELDDARLVGFTIPADDSSHFVFHIAPGAATDRAPEPTSADWDAENECAAASGRALRIDARIDRLPRASGGVRVAMGDITGDVHPTSQGPSGGWIEINSFSFSATGSDGVLLRDTPAEAYATAQIVLETGRPGTTGYMKYVLKDLIVTSVTQEGADGGTTLVKVGTGTLALAN